MQKTPLGPPTSGGAKREAFGPAPGPSPPLVDRGRGWYNALFPPEGFDFFHRMMFNQVVGGVIVGGITQIMPAGAQPFGPPTGRTLVVTDWGFYMWRADPTGMQVPLGQGEAAPYFVFRWLVDGVMPRMDALIITPLTRRPGTLMLASAYGPERHFPVAIAVQDNQTITAEFEVLAVPPAIVIVRAGFAFSGLSMPTSLYERIRRSL